MVEHLTCKSIIGRRHHDVTIQERFQSCWFYNRFAESKNPKIRGCCRVARDTRIDLYLGQTRLCIGTYSTLRPIEISNL